jgi:hypothetical protein
LLLVALIVLITTLICIAEEPHYIPKIIWTHWNSPKMPPNVARILEERKKALPNWTHIIVHDDTFRKYVDTEPPANFAGLSPQHRADWIRLALLKRYGGLWADSGIIFNSEQALDAIYDEACATRAHLTVFRLFDKTDKYLENWFIMAPQRSDILCDWHSEYNRAVQMGFKAYKERVFSKGVHIIEKIYKRDDDNVYLTQHACLQSVIQSAPYKSRILIKDAETSMFAVQEACNWDHKCIVGKLSQDPTIRHRFPYIKLRGGDRDFDMNKYFNARI